MKNSEYKGVAVWHAIVGVLLAVAVLWGVSIALNFFYQSSPEEMHASAPAVGHDAPAAEVSLLPKHPEHPAAEIDRAHDPIAAPAATNPSSSGSPVTASKGHTSVPPPSPPQHVPGIAFVKATIKPLAFELDERFMGWRSNDVVRLTDNVNNFQLGVLEVTRRTAVVLAERLSRTGSTASFEATLENAMNWFMIKADRYWLPSAETKYRDGLVELNLYIQKLEHGEATFYTRPDNLIPLLAAFEDLLGSCDENLVKQTEDNGDSVSFFRADNYFYYAQGVASAMGTILEAVAEDFEITLRSRHGIEIIHHAIESCHHAAHISPWVILNGDFSGILANHRANMAAPISHARFYVGILIKTLST